MYSLIPGPLKCGWYPSCDKSASISEPANMKRASQNYSSFGDSAAPYEILNRSLGWSLRVEFIFIPNTGPLVALAAALRVSPSEAFLYSH